MATDTITSAVTVSTTQGSSADFTPSFTVEANTYNISLDPASLDFGSKTRGYLFRPTKKDVTVKNDGNTAVTFIAPSENDGYDIDVPADWTSPLAPGATRVFSVRPKAGLIAGTYTAPIAISTRQGSSASLSPSFIVNGSLSVDISGDMDIIAGESTTLTANVTGGTGDYSYAWSGGGLTGADTRSVTVSPVSTTTYTVTVTDLGEGNEQASATVTVTAATHGIRLSVDDVSSSPVAVGYVQPVAHTVTVLYVGNIGSVTLIQPTATDYEIGQLSRTTLDLTNKTATFTVRPKPGLQSGSHSETLTVSTSPAQTSAVTLGLSFAVAQQPTVISPTDNRELRVVLGGKGTMQITAANAAGYQWYINRNDGNGFTAVNGATGASHTTGGITAGCEGFRYRCVVTGAPGTTPATSPEFVLRIVKAGLPDTGDSGYPGLWLALALMSAAAVLADRPRRRAGRRI